MPLERIKSVARQRLPRQVRWLKRQLFRLNPSSYKQYHFFPFDIMSPQPPGSLLKLGKLLHQVTAHGVSIRPSDGTLLGLTRDQRLIPHDNDLDFDVINSNESRNFVRKYASENGWNIGRIVRYRESLEQLVYFDDQRQIFDFVFWRKVKGNYLNFAEQKYVRVQPAFFFEQLELTAVGPLSFRRPRQLKEWLEFHYGEDWNVPQTEKKSWINECGDLVPWNLLR